MNTITVTAPPSKSISHRLFMCAALADGLSSLSNLLESDDQDRTRGCLQAMGATIVGSNGAYQVQGLPRRTAPAAQASLFSGESGTTCRLITGLAAAFPGSYLITGEGRMDERPLSDLVESLIPQGVSFEFKGKQGCTPLVMTTPGLPGGEISVSLGQSSQYLSGLLLAAPLARSKTFITISGNKVVSWPYVGLTLKAMQQFGVRVDVQQIENSAWISVPHDTISRVLPGSTRFVIEPQTYKPGNFTAEGDWSNASYFAAAGAIGPAAVTIESIDPDSDQGDRAILKIIQSMGAKVTTGQNSVTVSPGELHGQVLDMGSCPDIVPTIAALACFAKGETVISNVAHLRIKESDRIAAVAEGLSRAGAQVRILPDGLAISAGTLKKGQTVSLSTFADHRLAMSLSILELAGITVELDNPGCVAKSFPGFWEQWAKLR